MPWAARGRRFAFEVEFIASYCRGWLVLLLLLLLQNITREKSRNSDPRTLTNELLRRWNNTDILVVIVILIIIHVVIQVEKEHSSDLTADVARQQPPGSNLAGWIFLLLLHERA